MSSTLSFPPLDVVPMAPSETIEGLTDVKKVARPCQHERMFPSHTVLLRDFSETPTTGTIVILGAHRDDIHEEAGHEPSLQPKRKRLSSSVYNQPADGNVGMKPSAS